MYQSNNINNIFLHNTTMTKEANNGNGHALHPAQTLTNIKSHVPLTLDFKTVQYNTWAELFQVVARAHSVMNHLDGSPRATTKKWIQIDAIVLSWIYSTISEDLLPTILEPGSTARGAWLRVKKARVADLENQFNNCKLANFPDAKSYCQHLKSLADQLSDLGNVVSDQRLVLQLVKGLTLAYETVGITISSLEPLPSFCAVRKILETDVWKKRNLDGSPKVNGFRSYVSSFLGLPGSDSTKRCMDSLRGPDGELPEKLRNLEPHLIEHISNEIMDRDPNVRWDDIAGLHQAKKCVTEMVIWPLLRPDIFKGCRAPGRGLLLFGPPGTGKTMIGKAIAGEAKATFFYISASSLTSKWVGDSEKLVRALFGVASCRQPAVIFVDEIDSLLSQRKSSGEHDSIRRLKTQFLIEMEGFDSGNEQLLLIGATNRPQELDEAARRRLTKRLYIPLPSSEARAWIVRNLLEKDGLFKLSTDDIDNICKLTEGYSGSDMKNLVKDASMGPLREVLRQGIEITKLKKEDMRPVTLQDFEDALQEVRPSVSLNELGPYEDWNNRFGSLSPSSMKP